MKELSRRDFLKGTAAGAFGLATMGILGKVPAKAEGIYTPGTYSARAGLYHTFRNRGNF